MYIILLVLLIGANAFFAMTEIAVLSTNMKKMKKVAEEGDKRADILLKINEVPEKFLATIQVGVTLSGFLASAVAADNFVVILAPYLKFLPVSSDVLEGILLIVITIILAYFTLIFGELVPKRVAMKNPEKISLKVSTVVWSLYRFSKPFVAVLAASTNLVLKVLGIDSSTDEEVVTEEEVMMMVQEGEEQGNIENEEHQMIKNIFKLDDKRVSEVMTHRVDVIALNKEMGLQEGIKLIMEQGYSRVPVYDNDIDHIEGILYAKDLLALIGREDIADLNIADYLHEAVYIYEWKLCNDLLTEMKKGQVHIAIVVDEYGGTAGVVTLEDLLEVIVGEIDDEYDEMEEVVTLPEGVYILDGDMPLDKVTEILDEDFNEDEDERYESLAGLIISSLDRIPKQGECGIIGKYRFEITEVRGKKIEKVKLLLNKVEDTQEIKTAEEA